MNCSVYIIGVDMDGVMHAYPDDYATHDIFERFFPYLKEGSLYAIHRNRSLVYHVWYRRTAEGCFGICVLLNGVWFSESAVLLRVFDHAFSYVVAKGKLVRVGADGRIRTDANHFALKKTEIDDLDATIKEEITSFASCCVPLPTLNVSTNPLAIHSLPEGAESELFKKALKTYRSVCATYGSSTEGTTNMLLVKLEEIAKENASNRRRCQQLEKECKVLERSKKRYATIIVLVCIMALGGAIAISVIVNKNSEIRKQLATIENNEEQISSLNDKTDSLQRNIDDLQSKYDKITSIFPFRITDVEIGNVYNDGTIQTAYGYTLYSSETMYLKPKLYYTGYVSATRDLRVKLYLPSGNLSQGTGSPNGFTYSTNVYINTASNEVVLLGWGGNNKGHWSPGTYRIEIWYNDICLKTKSFTIY